MEMAVISLTEKMIFLKSQSNREAIRNSFFKINEFLLSKVLFCSVLLCFG